MPRLALLLTFLFVAACGGATADSGNNELERMLEANTTWPYEVTGVLEIVEAGGYGDDSDYPYWAVGGLINEQTDEFGISIEIDNGVARRAKVDVDSGKPVRAWLGEPSTEYGIKTYPISKLEAL